MRELNPLLSNIEQWIADGCPFDQIHKIEKKSWLSSHLISTGQAIATKKSQERIDFINQSIKKQSLHLPTLSKKRLQHIQITPFTSWARTALDIALFIPRCFAIFIQWLFFYPTYLYLSKDYTNSPVNPKTVKKPLTPTLLIHGSRCNQKLWKVAKYFLEGKNTGHLYSINLNDDPHKNNEMDIEDFVPKVNKAINQITEKYRKQGYKVEKINLFSHSMGGMVGAAVARHNQMMNAAVKIECLITSNTPWSGCPLADYMVSAEQKPEKHFRTDSVYAKELRKWVLENQGPNFTTYTISSYMDWVVPASSSALPTAPFQNMFSYGNDHATTLADPYLLSQIRNLWLAKHCQPLKKVKTRFVTEFKTDTTAANPS